MTDKPNPPARLAATVLLLRDGAEGLEVFMVVRHHQIDFASGALVFPGGRLETADHDIAASLPHAHDGDAPLRIAALRETFEECGVLLARPVGSSALVDGPRLAAIDAAHRPALNKGELSFAALLAEQQLIPATDSLTYCAHWITPEGRPKRFDTHFFMAEAPADQLAVHDGWESVESVWIRPQQAIDETNAGKRTLVFATRMTLTKLARHSTTAEALATARSEPVITIMPKPFITPEGRMIRIPAEAGFGGEVFPVLDKPAN